MPRRFLQPYVAWCRSRSAYPGSPFSNVWGRVKLYYYFTSLVLIVMGSAQRSPEGYINEARRI